MFLLIGVNERREDLDFTQVITCDECGAFGRFNVFVVCTVLYLFFIPVWKWNRRYYVETSCCHSLYELDPEVGAMIERGEDVHIGEEDLTLVHSSYQQGLKRCAYCGYETKEDFDYCPKCGRRF